MNSKTVLKSCKEYGLIALGILMYVVGWNLFLVPNNLIGGGVSGIAAIVQYATKGVIKIGYTYFVVNVGLMIAAVFILGKGFGSKTIYAIILSSIGLSFFQGLIPAEIVQELAIKNGKLMSTIIGGIIIGTGIGIAMSQGGSTGGTDIVALIINKYRNVSPGRMILMIDVIIILSSMVVPSYTADGEIVPWTEKFVTIIYGFILVVVNSTTLDMYLSGSRQSVQMFILSRKADEIADGIIRVLDRGVTALNGEGWYTKQPSKILMVIARRSDLNMFLRFIKSIDPDAFLSVGSVTGVYGKGFDTIKTRLKK